LDEIIEQYVSKDALRVHIDKSVAVNTKIEHQFVTGDDNNKLDTLAQFLKSQGKNRGIIFTRTKAVAKVLAKQLEAKELSGWFTGGGHVAKGQG
jgi:ATP-dependent RNA helicase DeaD